MGNIFGLRKRPTVPQLTKQDRAILQIKQQRDKIHMYQKKSEVYMEDCKQMALRLFQNGMQERALVVMKRRKCMQDIIHRTDKQLETLEQLVSEIEFTQAEVSVVQGLKIGNEALKHLTSLMNIEDIQKMMDDTQEAAEKHKEISDILTQSSERFDDSELIQELEKLSMPTPPQTESHKETEPTKDVSKETEGVVTDQQLTTAQDETTIEAKLEEIPAVPEAIPESNDKQTVGDKKEDSPKKRNDEQEEDEAQLVPA